MKMGDGAHQDLPPSTIRLIRAEPKYTPCVLPLTLLLLVGEISVSIDLREDVLGVCKERDEQNELN